MNQALTTSPIAFDDLRGDIAGSVIGPDDAGYDASRTVLFDQKARPAAIIRAACADDVARVVRLARETGLELAIRSGGHSGAGHGTVDGGIVLDLSQMKAVDLDVAGRTAWAETGLTAGELTEAVGAHGLVIGFGDTGSVGIGGITTGGGIGYLVRKHGMAIDNVIAADVVTADGRVVRTDAGHEPDLFWAIRGGGGNVGVVTRFQYRLHELPSVVGGMLILPATADVVAGFVAAADAAPDELSTIANVMQCPPMPFVPEEWHGKLVVMALMAWAGDEASGDGALAPFRALATPIVDQLAVKPYSEMFAPEDPDYHPIVTARTLFLNHVDRPIAQQIVATIEDHIRTTDSQMVVAQLRVLGGAMARVPADATAFAHRGSRIMVVLAVIVGSAEQLPAHAPWVESFARDLDQGDPGAYVSFLNDEGPERVRAAYPRATWDRLVAAKDRYDPTNLFHRNQNVPPSGASASSRSGSSGS